MGNFGISEGNITGRKKQKNTDYMPNHNSWWRSSPDARIRHQQVGLNREVQAALLKVRIRPECPEDNLRELT